MFNQYCWSHFLLLCLALLQFFLCWSLLGGHLLNHLLWIIFQCAHILQITILPKFICIWIWIINYLFSLKNSLPCQDLNGQTPAYQASLLPIELPCCNYTFNVDQNTFVSSSFQELKLVFLRQFCARVMKSVWNRSCLVLVFSCIKAKSKSSQSMLHQYFLSFTSKLSSDLSDRTLRQFLHGRIP